MNLLFGIWKSDRPVASHMETKLHVSCLFRLFWNTICLWQGCKINLLLVLFTVFELYSYLLKHLFETKPWFTSQPCLFMYNEYIYYSVVRDSYGKMGQDIAQRSAASTRFSQLPIVTWKVLTIWGAIIDVDAFRWTAKWICHVKYNCFLGGLVRHASSHLIRPVS